MKVPPKRKGNTKADGTHLTYGEASMKVPPKRKGNIKASVAVDYALCLNESPSEKEGKSPGNADWLEILSRLNESPSEKEGKWEHSSRHRRSSSAPQ